MINLSEKINYAINESSAPRDVESLKVFIQNALGDLKIDELEAIEDIIDSSSSNDDKDTVFDRMARYWAEKAGKLDIVNNPYTRTGKERPEYTSFKKQVEDVYYLLKGRGLLGTYVRAVGLSKKQTDEQKAQAKASLPVLADLIGNGGHSIFVNNNLRTILTNHGIDEKLVKALVNFRPNRNRIARGAGEIAILSLFQNAVEGAGSKGDIGFNMHGKNIFIELKCNAGRLVDQKGPSPTKSNEAFLTAVEELTKEKPNTDVFRITDNHAVVVNSINILLGQYCPADETAAEEFTSSLLNNIVKAMFIGYGKMDDTVTAPVFNYIKTNKGRIIKKDEATGRWLLACDNISLANNTKSKAAIKATKTKPEIEVQGEYETTDEKNNKAKTEVEVKGKKAIINKQIEYCKTNNLDIPLYTNCNSIIPKLWGVVNMLGYRFGPGKEEFDYMLIMNDSDSCDFIIIAAEDMISQISSIIDNPNIIFQGFPKDATTSDKVMQILYKP